MMSAGMARVRHLLQALQARAQAAMALAEKGPISLVQTLAGILPPLSSSGVFLAAACAGVDLFCTKSSVQQRAQAYHICYCRLGLLIFCTAELIHTPSQLTTARQSCLIVHCPGLHLFA